MERAGFTPMIAAEIHNMHLQLAFVQCGYGVGLLPARFIARNHSIESVKVLRPPSFDMHLSLIHILAAKNMASRETEFFENIGGVKSYTVDVFRLAG